MNINLSFLSQRVVVSSLFSDKHWQKKENTLVSSYAFLKQHLFLGFLSHETVKRNLKREQVISWNQVIKGRVILTSEKVLRVVLKKTARNVYSFNLHECQNKLKNNFRQFYLKIKEEQEKLKNS